MSFWKDLGKAAKNVYGTVNPIAGSMFAADDENKAVRKQIDKYNKNLERQAERTHHLSAAEGVGQQAAYQWASNMVRKHKDNPAALESVTGVASGKLEASSNRALQLRAAAIDMLSKRMVKPEKLTAAQIGQVGFKTTMEILPLIASAVTGMPAMPGTSTPAPAMLEQNFMPAPRWNDSAYQAPQYFA